MVVAKQRIQGDRDRALSLAWHTAALSRQQKLPDLRTLLLSSAQASPEQQRSVLHLLAERCGVKMRKFRLIRKPAA